MPAPVTPVTPGVFITTRAYGDHREPRARKGVTGRNTRNRPTGGLSWESWAQ